jgi:N-acetylglutamate synthase-like GNAT family acetyltransferase
MGFHKGAFAEYFLTAFTNFDLKMEIRIVNLSEIPDIIPMLAKWHHEQWAHLNPQASLKKRIDNYHTYLGDELVPSTYVALKTGGVAGSASIVKHDMDTRMEYSPWLASVYVHSDYRDKGIGSKLVSHVMAVAEKNGFESLYLFTPDKENFYKRLGWSTIHNESYHHSTVFIMARQFGP